MLVGHIAKSYWSLSRSQAIECSIFEIESITPSVRLSTPIPPTTPRISKPLATP